MTKFGPVGPHAGQIKGTWWGKANRPQSPGALTDRYFYLGPVHKIGPSVKPIKGMEGKANGHI